MIEGMKWLGEMERKEKCVVEGLEIMIGVEEKIRREYIGWGSFSWGFFSYGRLEKGLFGSLFVGDDGE